MPSERSPLPTRYLRERRVCVTGKLASMTHRELQEFVEANGGEFVHYPKRGQLLLVVGERNWRLDTHQPKLARPEPANPRFVQPTRVLARARTLKAMGYPVEIVDEHEFLDRLAKGAAGDARHQYHTIASMSRLLQIDPVVLRRWEHFGLLRPSETNCRLSLFDYEQVSFARFLCDALRTGISINQVRASLADFHIQVPEAEAEASQLTELKRERALFRTNAGILDQLRQRYFDFQFDDSESESAVRFSTSESSASHLGFDEATNRLIDEALSAEEAGVFEEAKKLYLEAIEACGNEPQLHFNLGNVYYAMDNQPDAEACYRRAIELDAEYAEAWNNLGHLQAEQDRASEAVRSFRRALALVPHFELAQENLDDLLDRMIVGPDESTT